MASAAMGSVAPVDLADGELIRRQKNLVHYPGIGGAPFPGRWGSRGCQHGHQNCISRNCICGRIKCRRAGERVNSFPRSLAECQETIFLLAKQLKALHPQTEFTGSPFSERSEKSEGLFEEEPTAGGMIEQDLSRADTAQIKKNAEELSRIEIPVFVPFDTSVFEEQ